MHIGVLTHFILRSAIERIVAGRAETVVPEAWITRAGARFDEDVAHSATRTWDRPRAYLKVIDPLLLEHLRGESLTSDALEAARTKVIDACTVFFADWFPWLATLRPEQFHLVDALQSLDFQGVQVYAAPDLVLRDAHATPWTVLDWKTGVTPDRAQLAAYAFWLVESHRDDPVPPQYPDITGLSISLANASSSLQMTMIDEVGPRIHAQIDADVAFMDTHVALALRDDPGAFPPNPGAACRSCTFAHLCPHAVSLESP